MSTNKHTAWIPTSTQHKHQQVHSINTKRGCFRKVMGFHQYTAWASTSTRHKHQEVHSINTKRARFWKIMGCHQYTASAPTSIQHQHQGWMLTLKRPMALRKRLHLRYRLLYYFLWFISHSFMALIELLDLAIPSFHHSWTMQNTIFILFFIIQASFNHHSTIHEWSQIL